MLTKKVWVLASILIASLAGALRAEESFPRWHFEGELGQNLYLPPAFEAGGYLNAMDMSGLLYGGGVVFRNGHLLLGLRGTVAQGNKEGLAIPVTTTTGASVKTYSKVQRFEVLPEIGWAYAMPLADGQWLDWRLSAGPDVVSLQHDGVKPKGAKFEGVYSTPLYIGFAGSLGVQYVRHWWSAGLFTRYSSVSSSASDAAYGSVASLGWGLRLGLVL
jgi:hypothetical protein